MSRAAAITLYRTLLLCYPSAFREEYGDLMLLMFVAQVGEARRNGSLFQQAKLWTQAALDVLTVAPKERSHLLSQDLRFALRGLRRNPVFTFAIIATLTLGIGSASAVFSLVDRVLFRGLPYLHANRLVSLGLVQSLEKNEFVMGSFYHAWRDRQTPFTAVTSQSAGPHPCDLTQLNPAHLNCIQIEANFLPTLGVSPVLGRNFTRSEDQPNGAGVALISYAFWRSRFNLQPNVAGKLIHIDGHPFAIVGVLPQNFEMPTLQPADVIFPMARDEAAERNGTQQGPRRAFALLKPGITVQQARIAMAPLFAFAQLQMPRGISRNDFHLSVRPLRDRQMHDLQLTSWVLFASVLAVLLIACANAASLLMARGAARERELAIRSSLGASRARLLHQALTEALLLSTVASLAGCALAVLLLRFFLSIAPAGLPVLTKATLDLRVFLFSLLLAILSGVLFSIVPGLKRPRPIALTVRNNSGVPHSLPLRLLVGAQLAISIVLLAGAALLLRSLWSLQTQDLGIQTRGVVTAKIDLPGYRYSKGSQSHAFFIQAIASAARLPGVNAVAVSSSLPPEPGHDARRLASIAVTGKPDRPTSAASDLVGRTVTPAYFKALEIHILRGRGFTSADERSNQRLVILSQILASHLFPGEDPIGRSVQLDLEELHNNAPPYTVIGVVADVKNSGLADAEEPEFYRLRRDSDNDWPRSGYLIVETTGFSTTTTAAWLRAQLLAIDPTLPLEVETMTQAIGALAGRPRFEAMALSGFAAIGFLMAIIGLYGVTAFIASRRTHEIGIRLAVGASRADILLLFVRDSVPLIAFGGVIGFSAALVLSRALHSLLFGIGPRDPVSFAAVSVLLIVVALAAVLLPASSAMRVAPVVALRDE